MLIERVVGRRLDPISGKIYHLKYSPPESDEIAARLIQRSDDTEEKVSTQLSQFKAYCYLLFFFIKGSASSCKKIYSVI